MTALQVLEGARERLSDRARWARGAIARRASGWPCQARSDVAASWCAFGAIAATGDDPDAQLEAERLLSRALPSGQHSVPDFNDSVDHAGLLAAFDRAIAFAKQEASC